MEMKGYVEKKFFRLFFILFCFYSYSAANYFIYFVLEVVRMKSIVSYPERGQWGDNKYRGNAQEN